MLLVVLFALLVLSVPLFGGRLLALAELELRGVWAIPAALGIQILIVSVIPDAAPGLLTTLHLVSYVLGGLFLWLNRRITGLWLVAAGAACNLLVISANGGVMPASPSAARSAGLQPSAGEFENSRVLDEPKLPWLGDVFAVPEEFPLSNVFSIGDALILVGAGVALHGVCGSRLMGRRRS